MNYQAQTQLVRRERLFEAELNKMTARLLEEELRQKEEARKHEEEKSKDDGEVPPQSKPEDEDAAEFTDSEVRKHKSILKIDTTCADAEVRYPVNVDIIHDGCKSIDRLIGKICMAAGIVKPRTCYKNARYQYLELVKTKKKGGKRPPYQ